MKNRIRSAVLAFAGAVASEAAADVVIPSSAFSSGANQALFQSDVRVYNPGSTPVTVIPVFYNVANGQTVTKNPFIVNGHTQTKFDNVLSSLFEQAQGAFGPIRFETDGVLVVSSSVNNVNACGNGAVSGQWLPGIDVDDASTSGTLVQLAVNVDRTGGYRSNVVFMNPGEDPATVEAKLRRGDGTLLSSRTVGPLAANGFSQLSLEEGNFPGLAGVSDTNLFLEYTSDKPVLSFASVINNLSGDPFAIVSVPPPVVPPGPPVAPVAAYTVSSSPTTGQPVTFTSTSTGSVDFYLWQFGDGTISAAGPVATKTYAAAGTFATELVVANAGGVSVTAKSVTVAAPAPTRLEITATTNGGTKWEFRPSPLALKRGTTYDLVFTSNDQLHGLQGLTALGAAPTTCFTLPKDTPCTVRVTPPTVGTFTYQCSQTTCGAGHNSMTAQIVVTNP